MKKISKALSIILTAFILMLPFDGFKAHASTEYAYSVGVNFGSSGTTTGDFTQNVLYDDFIENENILDDIYNLLEEKEEINKQELFAFRIKHT